MGQWCGREEEWTFMWDLWGRWEWAVRRQVGGGGLGLDRRGKEIGSWSRRVKEIGSWSRRRWE